MSIGEKIHFRSGRFLRSRVARRVFLLFVGCSLVPLLVFAGLAYLRVADELEQTAEQRLRREVKSVGVVLYERMLVLLADMQTLAAQVAADGELRLDDLPDDLEAIRARRFSGLCIRDHDGAAVDSFGAPVTPPELTVAEREHLATAGVVLALRATREGVGRFYLVLEFDDGDRGRSRIVAEAHPDFLLSTDGWVPAEASVDVVMSDGTGLFSSAGQLAAPTALRTALARESAQGRFIREDAAGRASVAHYRTIFLKPHLGANLVVVQHRLLDAITSPLDSFTVQLVQIALVSVLIVSFLSLIQIRRTLVPIETLAAATSRVGRDDLSARVAIHTSDEFADLGASFNEMAAHLERHREVMATVNDIGTALSRERSSERLIERIVTSARTLFDADGCAIYLAGSDDQLSLAARRVASLDISHTADPGDVLDAGRFTRALVNVSEFERDSGEWESQRRFDRDTGYRTGALMSIPMRDYEGEVVGVLRLFNPLGADGIPTVFPDEGADLASSLASQAALAITNNRLVSEFKLLFDALIQLLATAIDEKSPYTGGHCRRVPEITMLIAEAVCEVDAGPFASVRFTEDELYELQVAALLHDCGKVTTPVHVVDKGTKLETITDRIEVVDTRFEVVRRDVHIRALEAALDEAGEAGREAAGKIERHMRVVSRQIDDDRDFLRRANVGSEFMRPEDRERVRQIAEDWRWVGPGGEELPFLDENEVENLSIPKGTLTEAEREIVNYHVVATIKMLETLPYPRNLRNVPFIAGTHHERMDGQGYPNGLRGEEISLQGRILGLADIFEALTAKDRPYKPGKPLSEALRILGFMAQDGHVDHELFRLFVEQKLYLRYSLESLDPAQVDDVDLADIPGLEPPVAAGV